MKKTLAIVSLLAGAAVSVHAQGQVQWNSSVNGWQIYVYSGGGSTNQLVGDTKYSTPGGSVTFPGPAIGGTTTGTGSSGAGVYNGNNWMAGLYVSSSPSGLATALASGSPLATAGFVTTGGAGGGGWWVPNAQNQAPGDAIDSPNAGPYSSTVYVELAAWYTGGNAAINSYAAALTAGDPAGADGASSPIVLNSALSLPPTLAGSGLESFDIVSQVAQVPEPSTIALGVIGASAFLFRRRK
jgi:hypothetical protein